MHAFALICGGYFACEVEIGPSQKTLSIGAVREATYTEKSAWCPASLDKHRRKRQNPESDTCVFVEEKADIEGPEREHRDDFLAVTSMQSQNNTLPESRDRIPTTSAASPRLRACFWLQLYM